MHENAHYHINRMVILNSMITDQQHGYTLKQACFFAPILIAKYRPLPIITFKLVEFASNYLLYI